MEAAFDSSIEGIKLYHYEYDWAFKFFLAGEDPNDPENKNVVIPGRIKLLTKKNDFINNLFPVFEIEFTANKYQVYNVLYKNAENLLASGRQTVYKYDLNAPSGMSADVREPIEREILYDEIFIPLIKPASFSFIDQPQQGNATFNPDKYADDRDLKDGENAEFSSNVYVTVTAVLYSYNGLRLNKSIVNAVLDKASVGSGLLYILESAKELKYAIVDQPNNVTEYESLVLVPTNIKNSILNLQTRYGIYENGISVFYDYNTLFILDRFKHLHETEKDDHKYSLIQVYDSREGEVPLQPANVEEAYVDGKRVFIYRTTIFPKKPRGEYAISELTGTSYLYTNYGMSKNIVVFQDGELKAFKSPSQMLGRTLKRNANSGDKIILDYDELNNPYNLISYVNLSDAMSEFLEITLDNVAAKSFKPNKTFRLKFADAKRDKEFGGFYVPINSVLFYEPTKKGIQETETRMSCSAKVTLVRAKM